MCKPMFTPEELTQEFETLWTWQANETGALVERFEERAITPDGVFTVAHIKQYQTAFSSPFTRWMTGAEILEQLKINPPNRVDRTVHF